MISYEVIDGRKATIAYINDELEPVDRDEATMIKIIFDDGEVRFGVKSSQDRLKSQFRSEKRRALALLQKGDFIRDPVTGEFMGSHPGPGHGEGEGGGGGSKPSAVPGYSAGLKASADKLKEVRQKWVDESPIQTMADVIREAPKAQATLGKVGNEIAAKLGVTYMHPTAKTQKLDKATGKIVENPKGVARILAKTMKDGKQVPLARVTDTARGTFVLNHPSDALKVINELTHTYELIDEGWRTIPDSHYTDRPLLFRDRETGLIGEIQLSHPDLLEAKDHGGGHELYDYARELPIGHPDIPIYNAKMQALYGSVLDKLTPEWSKAIDGRRKH